MPTISDQPLNVLLVDDEARNLDALEVILSDEGYRLMRATAAAEALRILLAQDVAIVVLDIRMPDMDGLELAALIKQSERHRDTHILFVTAHLVEDADVVAGYGAGAVDYLTKPLNPHIMRHKLQVFAELTRKTRALAALNEQLEQRVAERTSELERSEAALRAASRQKDEFLMVLAHELRNPLAPLRTGLELLSRHATADAVGERTLSAMNRQVDHVVRLVDDLLDISRINRGTLELKKERTDLGALVRAAVETFQPLFAQRGIALTAEAPPAIAATVDATRITQIVGNFLHNAAKCTPEGGRVTVALGCAHGDATISVTDTGIGLEADRLEQIFEIFENTDRYVASGESGLGVGLGLARRLARCHGGDVTASSPGPQQGATFTLRIPGAERLLLEAEVAPKPAAAHAQRLRILVVEDNEDAAELIAVWLREEGHHVALARTGAEGLEKIFTELPELVLCDIGLPGMDGYEVCTRVRKAGRDVQPIMVALTGWGTVKDVRLSREAGFDSHLVKPVSLDRLAKLIAEVPDKLRRSRRSGVDGAILADATYEATSSAVQTA